MSLARYILRHNHRFVCWWPRVDRSGLWPTTTWAFWTWDNLPEGIGSRFVAQAQDLRRPARAQPVSAVGKGAKA
jgi:hypothetical protein